MVLVDRLLDVCALDVSELDVCEFDVCELDVREFDVRELDVRELDVFLLAALRSILSCTITSSQDNIAVHQLDVSETVWVQSTSAGQDRTQLLLICIRPFCLCSPVHPVTLL